MTLAKISKEYNWEGVPPEHQAAWLKIFLSSHELLHLSAPCPVCSVESLCHWYQIGKPIDRVIEGARFTASGGLWEWCRNCHSYQHYSCLVPDWWSCDLSVDIKQLTTLLTAIEEAIAERDLNSKTIIPKAD
jgi:hypothetical protein